MKGKPFWKQWKVIVPTLIVAWMVVAVLVAAPDNDRAPTVRGDGDRQAQSDQDRPEIVPGKADPSDPGRPATPKQIRAAEDRATLATVDWDDEAAVLRNARLVGQALANWGPVNTEETVRLLSDVLTVEAQQFIYQSGQIGPGPKPPAPRGKLTGVVLDTDQQTGARMAIVRFDSRSGSGPVQHLYAELEFLPDRPIVSRLLIQRDY